MQQEGADACVRMCSGRGGREAAHAEEDWWRWWRRSSTSAEQPRQRPWKCALLAAHANFGALASAVILAWLDGGPSPWLGSHRTGQCNKAPHTYMRASCLSRRDLSCVAAGSDKENGAAKHKGNSAAGPSAAGAAQKPAAKSAAAPASAPSAKRKAAAPGNGGLLKQSTLCFAKKPKQAPASPKEAAAEAALKRAEAAQSPVLPKQEPGSPARPRRPRADAQLGSPQKPFVIDAGTEEEPIIIE